MAELKGSPAGDEGKSWRVKHGDVLADEITAINQRRAAHEGLEPVEPKAPQGGSIDAEAVIDAVGLTLSGGGIRSAAVCLGVLQGLNHHDLIKRIDYLSTVSGGGYMGSSLTTTMTRTGGFVFGGAPVGSGL